MILTKKNKEINKLKEKIENVENTNEQQQHQLKKNSSTKRNNFKRITTEIGGTIKKNARIKKWRRKKCVRAISF